MNMLSFSMHRAITFSNNNYMSVRVPGLSYSDVFPLDVIFTAPFYYIDRNLSDLILLQFRLISNITSKQLY